MPLSGWEYQSGGQVRDQDERMVVTIGSGANGQSGLATEATIAKRFGGFKTTAAVQITTVGDTIVHTPASGKTITFFWIGMSSSQTNTLEVLVTVRLGSRVVYEWYMGNPGAFAHWEPETADNPNDALIVNLSAGGQPVLFNYTYTEQ